MILLLVGLGIGAILTLLMSVVLGPFFDTCLSHSFRHTEVMSGEYRFKESSSALGPYYELIGPGLGYHGTYLGVHLTVHSEPEAERLVRMLTRAYEAGRKAKGLEIQRCFGISV